VVAESSPTDIDRTSLQKLVQNRHIQEAKWVSGNFLIGTLQRLLHRISLPHPLKVTLSES